jgi:uncharacterized protein YjbJ (UPF0337 family)
MDSSIKGEVRREFGKVQGGVGDLTGDTKTQAEGRANEAAGTVEKLADKAKDVIKDAAGSASDLAREAYDKGERYARDMRDRLPDAERYWREGSQAVRHQVGESPVVVALLAGLVGLVIGWLVFHQSSDTRRDHHRR